MRFFFYCLLIAFLIPPALTDFIVCRLPVSWLLLSFPVLAAVRLCLGADFMLVLTGMLPGIVLMVPALLDRGIAWGDAFTVMTAGCLVGWESCLLILLAGTFTCGVYMLARHRRQAPFVPGLLAAAWLLMILELAGEKGIWGLLR